MSNTKSENVPNVMTAVKEVFDPVILTWFSQPAKGKPLTTTLVVALLVAITASVYFLTYSPLFTFAAALILWGSLSQYFVKTRYELTEMKVKVKYIVNKIEKEWSQYRSYYVDKNGILLSPFVRPSRLENFRGLYIRFAGNRDDVIAVVKSKIQMIGDDR